MSDKDKIDFSMFLDNYYNDAKEGFQQVNNALLSLEKDYSHTELLDEIFRPVHTLKSSSTMLEFSDIAELAHICEDLLDRMRKNELSISQATIDLLFEIFDTLEEMVRERVQGKEESKADWRKRISELKSKINDPKESSTGSPPQPELNGSGPSSEIENSHNVQSLIERQSIEKIQMVRVHVDLLDSLFNLVGELIITKNRINNIVTKTANKDLKAALTVMDHIINELQQNVSAARLVPVDEIFQKFPRMIRDLAKDAHKEVDFFLEGREIELDKAVLDSISEPLIHLLRNAVDHGIEPVEIREKLRKKKSGTIKLAAKRSENHIFINVEDDGSGIDVAHMKQVFSTKGLIKPEEVELLEDNDVLDLLFKSGFSSAEEVSDLSGRGVGLDVVKTSVRQMGGTVEVATQKGKETRFTLKLPLTTAIIQTLMVGIGNHVFAIPSDIVLETLEVKPHDIKEIRNDKVLVLRKEMVPFFRLDQVLNIPPPEDQENLIAVIIQRGGQIMGLGVEAVLDQTENIIKPFDPIAQQFKGFSGGTILGDGRVALLLDIPSLL